MLPGEAEFNAAQAAKAPVRVVVNGQAGTVPASQLDAAKAAGATEEEAPADTLGSLWAGALHVGSAVGGGLMPAVSAKVAYGYDKLTGGVAPGVDAKAYTRAYKENYESAVRDAEKDHPTASALGTGIGMGLDLLGPIGKGAGALGAGAKALAGGEALGRIAAGAVSAGAQQAAFNVGHQVSEDYLGDVDSNAEKLFAAAANKETLFAAAAGGALTGAGELWSAGKGLLAARKGVASAAMLDAATGVPGAGKLVKQEGEATGAAVDALRKQGKTLEQAQAAVSDARVAAGDAVQAVKSGAPEGFIHNIAEELSNAHAGLAATSDMSKEDIKAAFAQGLHSKVQREIKMAALARDLQGVSDDMLKSHSLLHNAEFGARRALAVKMVDPASYSTARDVSASLLQDTEAALAAMKEYQVYAGPELVGKVKDFRAAIAAAGDSSNPTAIRQAMADLHATGNLLKMELGRSVASKAEKNLGSNAFRIGNPLYDKMRQALESPEAWGKMGEYQAGINRAFSENAEGAFAFHGEMGARPLEKDVANPWKGQAATDPGKWQSALEGLGSNHTAKKWEAVHRWVTQAENMGKVAGAAEGLTPEQVAAANTLSDGAKRMRAAVNQASAEANVINKLNQGEALAREAQEHSILGHGLLGSVVSHVSEYVANPLKVQQTLAAAAHGVDSFTGAISRAAKSLTSGDGAKVAGKVAGKALGAGTGAAKEEIAQRMEGVRAVNANPNLLAANGTRFVGQELQTAAPKHAASTSAVAQRAVAFLAANATAGYRPTSVVGNGKPRYTDEQLARFDRAYQAVRDPMSVVASVETGSYSREGIGALQQVYPRIFAELQTHVTQQLADMDAKGQTDAMSLERRRYIGILLQVPATADQQRDYIDAVQATKAPPPKQQPGGGVPQGGGRRPITLASNTMKTDAETISAGGRVQ